MERQSKFRITLAWEEHWAAKKKVESASITKGPPPGRHPSIYSELKPSSKKVAGGGGDMILPLPAA